MDREQILAAAAEIGDHAGLGALTTTRLAERLRIKPPSLYQHFANIEVIKDALAMRALGELIDLHKDVTSGRAGREALNALAHAQRTYAQARPGRFLAAMQASPGTGAIATLRQTYVRLVATTLETYLLEADAAIEVSRSVVAALQGFLIVELSGLVGTPFETDQGYQKLVDMLDAGARAAARSAANRKRTPAAPAPASPERHQVIHAGNS
ncbi:MAG TPA: TetR/AcrR family transcriptional regulator [Caulobacteraceae bacterium]|nr:TetR/AcrR family transcriptional regulator [Caulobacteraceae bacterium]